MKRSQLKVQRRGFGGVLMLVAGLTGCPSPSGSSDSGDAGADVISELSNAQDVMTSPESGSDAATDAPLGRAPVRQLAMTTSTSCALMNNGVMSCWGSLSDGSGVRGQSTGTPNAGVDLQGATQVSVTSNRSCAVKPDQTVLCWGRDDSTQPPQFAPPAVVPTIADAAEVVETGNTTCVRSTQGTVRCWGFANLIYGSGEANPPARTAPGAAVMNLSDATQIAMGASSACARRRDGTVVCWGANNSGQIGDGSPNDALAPTMVRGLDSVEEIAMGTQHVCARKSNGTVYCWGAGTDGQIGNDDVIPTNPEPVAVTNLTDAVEIDAAGEGSCARRRNGTIVCWGNVPRGTTASVSAGLPSDVEMISDAVELAVASDHVCVRRATGGLACWGGNLFGQIGDGTSGIANSADARKTLPVAVVGF